MRHLKKIFFGMLTFSLGGHIAPMSVLATDGAGQQIINKGCIKTNLNEIEEKLENDSAYKQDFTQCISELHKCSASSIINLRENKVSENFLPTIRTLYYTYASEQTYGEKASAENLKTWFFETQYTYDAFVFLKRCYRLYNKSGRGYTINELIFKELSNTGNRTWSSKIFDFLNISIFKYKRNKEQAINHTNIEGKNVPINLSNMRKDNIEKFSEILLECKNNIIKIAKEYNEHSIEENIKHLETLLDKPEYEESPTKNTKNTLCTFDYTKKVIQAIEETPVLKDILAFTRCEQNKNAKQAEELLPHFKKIFRIIGIKEPCLEISEISEVLKVSEDSEDSEDTKYSKYSKVLGKRKSEQKKSEITVKPEIIRKREKKGK